MGRRWTLSLLVVVYARVLLKRLGLLGVFVGLPKGLDPVVGVWLLVVLKPRPKMFPPVGRDWLLAALAGLPKALNTGVGFKLVVVLVGLPNAPSPKEGVWLAAGFAETSNGPVALPKEILGFLLANSANGLEE